ncbi:MAG: acyltransferase [Candidatus Syntropharchaeia archaeon]
MDEARELRMMLIPDNTKMEERNFVVDGDVLIGNHSEMDYGIIAKSIIAGERVKIRGDLVAEEDVRIDLWSEIRGNVRVMNDAYLGEYVKIHGKLSVEGDLDIGDNVDINGGFEAKGWIVIRNPIPVILFIYFYILELFRLGKSEEVEKILEELFEEESNENNLMVIPDGTKITKNTIRIPEKTMIGRNCRLSGNIRTYSLKMGDGTTLFGSIRAKEDIHIGKNCTIHGNLFAGGIVYIDENSHVLGEISARYIEVHERALVDGKMRAPAGVLVVRTDL